MALELNRYFKYLKRGFFRKSKLNFLILYVTDKCNLSCQSCFFHQSLNTGNGLALPEYEKIAENAGKFSILLLSGGEPFLQNNLVEICSAFIDKCSIDSLLIPTNAALTEIVALKTEELLKKYPSVSISVNPSLDGLAAYHDKNRGQVGTFEKALKTIEKLCALKSRYSNLKIVVNSVMEENNLDELRELTRFMRRFNIDFHDFEILRGDYKDKKMRRPSLDKIKTMHQLILANRYWYLKRDAKKMKSRLVNSFIFLLEKAAIIGALKYSQVFKEMALAGKRWPSPCPAGKGIAVIYPNGDYADCEIKKPSLNLKNFNCDFSRLRMAEEKARQSGSGVKVNCACTHVCFIHAAQAADWKSFLKISYYYFKSRKFLI